MEEIIGHGIYHSNKPCDRTSSPASDMQSQRKAGHIPRREEEGDEREKKRGKKACYHQIKKIDTNRLNLLSQKQEFYIVFLNIQNLNKNTGIYLIYTVI